MTGDNKILSVWIFLFISISCISCFVSGGAEPRLETLSWQDKIITTDISINNKTIYVDGNLSITSGCVVRFSYSEIIMKPVSNGSSKINVDSESHMELNNCSIRSYTGFKYHFFIYGLSKLQMVDSSIKDCGFWCSTADFDEGLFLQNSQLIAENSDIYYDNTALFLTESTIELNGCNFFPSYYYGEWLGAQNSIMVFNTQIRSNVTLRNCSIYGALNYSNLASGGTTLYCLNADVLIENSIVDHQICYFSRGDFINVDITHVNSYWGVLIDDYSVTFQNCTIKSLNKAVLIDNANAVFTNCTIQGNKTDIELASGPPDYARVDLINTSIASNRFNNNISVINYSQFLNLNVINKHDLSPIGNVTANVFDAGGKRVFQGTTADDGTINWIPLMWKVVKNQETRIFTPHRIFITKGNASANVTGINMSVNRDIVIPFDDSPPSLVITNPQDGTVTNRSDINVAGFVDTDSSLTLNGQTLTTGGGPFNITYWLDEGDNLLTFKGKDDFGNTVQKVIHVTLMTVPPSINLTEPEEGAITNLNPVMVKGWTNGSRVEINGVPVSLGAAGNFTYSWNILVEGKQTVSVNAWDRANNSRTLRRNIFYDITPPEIEFVSPLNNSWTGIGTVDITIRLPDAVNAKVDGTSKEPGTGGVITFRKSLNDGENRISITAWDAAGNANSTTLAINLDTSNFLELTEPSGDILTNRTMLTVKGRTEKGATVLISGEPADNIDGNFTFSLGLKEGMNKITAVSTDRAGNRAEKTSAVTLDTISPELTVISPTDLVSNEARITIKLRSETGAIVTVNGVRANVTGDIYTCDIVLVKGENNFILSAKDLAGNTNATGLIISYVPPKPTAPDPTVENGFLLPAVILAIIILIILGSFFILRKRKTRQ